LASLSPDERKKTIESYNAAINKKKWWKLNNSNKIDIGYDFVMDAVRKLTGLDFLGTALTGIKIIGKKAINNNPELKHLASKMEELFTIKI